MNKISAIFTLLLFEAFFLNLSAQFFNTGTDPASIRWSQIRTPGFRVVFPDGFHAEALRTAHLLEKTSALLDTIYFQPRRKVPFNVIIHNYSTESNGYVAWAPRRMELFPAPPQNSIPSENLLQLTAHEAVHMKQMRGLETGFSGFLSKLGGQQVTGIVSALLPMWLFEGDAVVFETLLSPSGRGNNPQFNKDMKALITGNETHYSYNKFLLGSYRNYVPDYYRYGSILMEYSRSIYGNCLWKNAVKNTASKPFLINPTNISLKKNIGLTKESLFYESLSSYRSLWHYELSSNAFICYTPLSPDKSGNYINYFSPTIFGNDSIIAIKTSFYKSPSIILLTNAGKTEKQLVFTGRLYPCHMTSASGKIVWAESRPDPRWENRSFSVIRIYDVRTGKSLFSESESRYFAPAISNNGSSIVAVENTPENQNYLVFLDPENLTVLKRIPIPGNSYPQRPQWSCNDEAVIVILLSDCGESIFIYSISDDEWTCLIDPSYNDLKEAVVRNDSLFFISSAGGTDNLFLRTPGGEIQRLSNSRYGTGSFCLNGNNIVFTDYDQDGYFITSVAIEPEECDYNNMKNVTSTFLYEMAPLSKKIQSFYVPATDTNHVYSIKPYKKWKNLINLHSWAPFYYDLDKLTAGPLSIKPGISLFSQNLLSTLETSVGYEYDDGQHLFHSSLKWRGWYPVLSLSLTYGGNPEIISNTTGVTPSVVNRSLSSFAEIYLPLNYSSGRFTRYFHPSVSHQYSNRYIYKESAGMFDYGQVFITTRFYFSNTARYSYRDIFPPLAQVFDLFRTSSPFDRELYGPVSSFRSAFFFPGFIKNHGIRIKVEAEMQKPRMFIHHNRISFPRGYNNRSFIIGKSEAPGKIISEQLTSVSFDYTFPVAYPDIGLGSFLYIKRLRAAVFHDFAKGLRNRYITHNRFEPGPKSFSSSGGELLADFNLFRIPFDISGGIRGGRLSVDKLWFFEWVLSVDIYGFRLGMTDRQRSPLL